MRRRWVKFAVIVSVALVTAVLALAVTAYFFSDRKALPLQYDGFD